MIEITWVHILISCLAGSFIVLLTDLNRYAEKQAEFYNEVEEFLNR